MNKFGGTILAAAAGLVVAFGPQQASAATLGVWSHGAQLSQQGLLHQVTNQRNGSVRNQGASSREGTGNRYRGNRSQGYNGNRYDPYGKNIFRGYFGHGGSDKFRRFNSP